MLAFLLLIALATGGGPAAAADGMGPDGLEFVSLKADEVNMRAGPGMRYPVRWVYRRRGLPLEVLARFEHWRKVRDLEDTVGWVHRSLLSSRRTAIVIDSIRPLRAGPSVASPVVAEVEPGVIGEIRACPEAAGACRMVIDDYDGWLDRSALWGIAPREVIE